MANFVQVQGGQVIGRYDLLPTDFNGQDLTALTAEERLALGWYPVSKVEEPLGWDGNTHKVTGPTFTINATDVIETYTLEELPADVVAANLAAKAEAEAAAEAERLAQEAAASDNATPVN
jgi:hypothetical protein